MDNTSSSRSYVRWTARILGGLMILFGGFFLFGHLFGAEDGLSGFHSSTDILSFLCFPISTLIGLTLAWKWEAVGALITLGGMLGLILLRPDLFAQLYLFAPVIPALLFLLSWYKGRYHGSIVSHN
ncbi:MAG: hypothetical protein AAF587_29355 [Bacteroidota bacterium]